MNKESNRTSWRVQYNEGDVTPVRQIVHGDHPIVLDPSAYNYQHNTPLVLAPISRSITLVLSEYRPKPDDPSEIGLRIQDLRFVENSIVGSVVFTLRGSQAQINKLKYEMLRASDDERCVGVSYLLRKIYYCGFSTIYAPKKLRTRESDTLRNTFNLIKLSQEDDGNGHVR